MINCKDIREKFTNLNKREFANTIGLSYSTYYYYENGREPSIDVLVRISDYLGVSIDALLEREKKDTPETEVSNLGSDQRAIQKLAEKLDDAQASQVYNYMLFVIDQKAMKYENYNF